MRCLTAVLGAPREPAQEVPSVMLLALAGLLLVSFVGGVLLLINEGCLVGGIAGVGAINPALGYRQGPSHYSPAS